MVVACKAGAQVEHDSVIFCFGGLHVVCACISSKDRVGRNIFRDIVASRELITISNHKSGSGVQKHVYTNR